jgi:hypothetical protein
MRDKLEKQKEVLSFLFYRNAHHRVRDNETQKAAKDDMFWRISSKQPREKVNYTIIIKFIIIIIIINHIY